MSEVSQGKSSKSSSETQGTRAENKKILLVGASGMLGADLAEVLASHPEITGDQIVHATSRDLDISNTHETASFVGQTEPTLVINCAAFSNVDGSELERERAFAVNADGPGNLASACRKAHATLIHISSDYVFDGRKGKPYVETDQPNPISKYGQSKLAGELAVQDNCEDFLIVRTAWLYGKNGRNFVDSMLQLATEKEELRIVSDQVGSPTWTRDLAAAILALIDKECKGIYHVTNDGPTTWFEFAREAMKLRGLEVKLVPIKTDEWIRPATPPPYSVLDCTKLTTDTGYTMRPWIDALRTYLSAK